MVAEVVAEAAEDREVEDHHRHLPRRRREVEEVVAVVEAEDREVEDHHRHLPRRRREVEEDPTNRCP